MSTSSQLPLLHLDDRRIWSRWQDAAHVAHAELTQGPILTHALAATSRQSMCMALSWALTAPCGSWATLETAHS